MIHRADDAVGPAPQPLSLRANFLALTAGRVCAALAQWAALIVVAKATDVATVGEFALAQVICIPIAEIARLGLREVKATDVERSCAFRHYFGLRIVVAALAFVAMLSVGAVAANSVTVLAVVALYAGSRVVELLSDIVYGLFQVQERLDYVGRSLALVAPLSIVMLTVGMLATGSLLGAVGGQLLAYLLVFVFHDLAVARRQIAFEKDDSLRPSFDHRALLHLIRLSVPLTLATLLAIIAVDLPRILVAAEHGTEALGVFAPLFVLAMAPTRIVQALGTAVTTPLAGLHGRGDRRAFASLLVKLALGAAGVGLAGVALAVAAGEWILRTVYTTDYGAHVDLFVVLLIASALRMVAVLLQFGVIASRRFWWLTAEKGAVAVVAVIAGVTLVPRGLYEAGLAVVVAFAVQVVIVGWTVVANLPVSGPAGDAETSVD